MTEFFEKSEFDSVKKQRNTAIIIFSCLTAIYLAAVIAGIIVFNGLPYKDPSEGVIKAVLYLLSAVYVIFAFLYMGLKFRRVNAYYKMLKETMSKEKTVVTGRFLRVEPSMETKDGVDIKKFVISVYNERRNDYFERMICIPYEKEFPLFTEGDTVTLATHENILFSYEKK